MKTDTIKAWARTAPEPEMKLFLEQQFSSLFFIEKEVPGNFLIDGTPVIIDYIFRPRDELRMQGFPDISFGVEVKALPKGSKNVISYLAWQSITYAQSNFTEFGRPAFVLTFPPIKWFETEDQKNSTYQLLGTLQHGNVGSLDVREKFWKIVFGQGCYFHSITGPGAVKNLGTKRNCGNFK